MLYSAKSNGITNATLDKFLKVVALVMNGKRNVEDDRARNKFPASVRSVKRACSHEEQQKVIHIRHSYERDLRLYSAPAL
ncbi:hypothetical protein RvY_11275 [Ramazzottius varieornatus]|uniref:Uncharacterized protein n=1 Tax=Ramazzottius varieornatus TaxID=947166 RepID=A0A1D1VI03_RAMVA|nr:hypothetical protein RvY_11275 [Ramazzottius varieornatus]